jgi:hypothetical protein
MARISTAAVILALAYVAGAPAVTAEPPQRPYSRRLLDDEQKKCAIDPDCDQRVFERLKRECLRDGGRP